MKWLMGGLGLLLLVGCSSRPEPSSSSNPPPGPEAKLAHEDRAESKPVVPEPRTAPEPPEPRFDPEEMRSSLEVSTALALASDESPPLLEPDDATRARAHQLVGDAVAGMNDARSRIRGLIEHYPYKFASKHGAYLESLAIAEAKAIERARAVERARADAKLRQVAKVAPDPRYEPEYGDLCSVGSFDPTAGRCDAALAAKNEVTYRMFWVATRADNERTLAEIQGRGDMVHLASGTLVEVLRIQDFASYDPRPRSVFVRVDEGPAKDQLFWMPRSAILQKRGDSAVARHGENEQARLLIESGQTMESFGSGKEAIKLYSEVVNEFPGTPEATRALNRIKALDGEVLPGATVTETDPAAASARVPSSYSSSLTSGLCGAPTKRGGSCMRRVRGGGYCYQHR